MAKRSGDVEHIVVHCTATRPSQDIGLTDIDAWHRHRGFLGCGYHLIIKRDGTVEHGRGLDEVGAHARGFNHNSIAVALVGGVTEEDVNVPENNFTDNQFTSLREVLTELKEAYQSAQILGHRDLPNVNKACPSFDVQEWLDSWD